MLEYKLHVPLQFDIFKRVYRLQLYFNTTNVRIIAVDIQIHETFQLVAYLAMLMEYNLSSFPNSFHVFKMNSLIENDLTKI